MHLVRNEQVKLVATLLSNLAAISIGAGVVTPLVALTSGYGSKTASVTDQEFVVYLGIGWILLAAALHLMARSVLRGLRE